jgi:hypothetical protein
MKVNEQLEEEAKKEFHLQTRTDSMEAIPRHVVLLHQHISLSALVREEKAEKKSE